MGLSKKFKRFFRSFEFIVGCVFVVFVLISYWLVSSLMEKVPEETELVWVDNYKPSNFDSQFATPYERYDIDLALWSPVEDRLLATHSSVVRQRVTRTVIRQSGQDEYLLSLHTSGLKPNFVCLTHSFGFTKDYNPEKPFGAEKLTRYTARIDVSKEPVGEPFELSFVIFSWNAFQGEENQVFGVYAKSQAKEVIMQIRLPDIIDKYELRLELFDKSNGKISEFSRAEIEFASIGDDTFRALWRPDDSGDGFFIRWR